MGSLHIEMFILAIHGELIPGTDLYEIVSKSNMSMISKSNMSIIGTQNSLAGYHVKTTSYCIDVAASVIYLKLIEAHWRSS